MTEKNLADMTPEEREAKLYYPYPDAPAGANAIGRSKNIDILLAFSDADRAEGERRGRIAELEDLLDNWRRDRRRITSRLAELKEDAS